MNQELTNLNSYNFKVPINLVAQEPLPRRSDSRLLVWKGGRSTHESFRKFPSLIPQNSLIVLNESRVFPSRILAKTKFGGNLELFLLTDPSGKQNARANALGKPLKKLKLDQEVILDENLSARVVSKKDLAGFSETRIQFNQGEVFVKGWLKKKAYVPLPPYIKREGENLKPFCESADANRYQTVYANKEGSVAAPTAGLHFTKEILEDLRSRGVDSCKITLHVGAGTFLPVKRDQISEHEMHEEQYYVPKNSLEKLEEARVNKRPIVCIGTTTLRCLEGFITESRNRSVPLETLADKWLSTNIFIRPDLKRPVYKPYWTQALVTNFHQPMSSLYILICALVGISNAKEIYAEAIKKGYRFYSYGDTSLLWI